MASRVLKRLAYLVETAASSPFGVVAGIGAHVLIERPILHTFPAQRRHGRDNTWFALLTLGRAAK